MQPSTQESALAPEFEQAQSTPVASVRGTLKANYKTGEVFFHSENGRKYYTLSEYHKWVDMPCEAEIDYDQSIEAANIGGCAYRIILVDELPSPLELEDAARSERKATRYFLLFSVVLLAFSLVLTWFVAPSAEKLVSEPTVQGERAEQMEYHDY